MTNRSRQEFFYKLLAFLSRNPNASQRRIAEATGASVGKVNAAIYELIRDRFITKHLQSPENRLKYAYTLTEIGLKTKERIAKRLLKRKLRERDLIEEEIRELKEVVTTRWGRL